MSEIEWVVGELYEDRDGDIYKLIYDGRKDDSLDENCKLIFTVDSVVTRCPDGSGCAIERGDIIKKHEPEKSKKEVASVFIDRVVELGKLYEKCKTHKVGHASEDDLRDGFLHSIEEKRKITIEYYELRQQILDLIEE